jgi:putative transposase
VKKRFSEEQIIGFLREADRGVPVKELCRKHGLSNAGSDLWHVNSVGCISRTRTSWTCSNQRISN